VRIAIQDTYPEDFAHCYGCGYKNPKGHRFKTYYDEATGETLWQFKTGSSINSTAITYTHNGRQYVTVASGLGGGLANRYAAGKVPTGGSVWTFTLMPEN